MTDTAKNGSFDELYRHSCHQKVFENEGFVHFSNARRDISRRAKNASLEYSEMLIDTATENQSLTVEPYFFGLCNPRCTSCPSNLESVTSNMSNFPTVTESAHPAASFGVGILQYLHASKPRKTLCRCTRALTTTAMCNGAKYRSARIAESHRLPLQNWGGV